LLSSHEQVPIQWSKIISILQRNEAGERVKDVCREFGISDATFYNWKAKYGGLSVNQLKRLKELQDENSRLKVKRGSSLFRFATG